MELCPLAGFGQEDMTTGGSQVAGIGLIWYFDRSIMLNVEVKKALPSALC
jgi:hypothetical protein